jgi:hypothetical protein
MLFKREKGLKLNQISFLKQCVKDTHVNQTAKAHQVI